MADPSLFLTSFIIVVCLLSLVGFSSLRPLIFRSTHPKAPPFVQDNSLITGAHGFWDKRWTWFQQSRKNSKTGNFSFHAGRYHVVGTSGAKCRQWFFNSRELGLTEAYSVLLGQLVKLDGHDNGIGKEQDSENYFQKRLQFILKGHQLPRRLPILIADTERIIAGIRNDSCRTVDPFDTIYRTVVKLTIRMLACDEIAEDQTKMDQMIGYYKMIDASATRSAILFPTLPTLAAIKRTYAGARLYMLVENIIKKRAKTGEKHDDTLQHLIDRGDRTHKIVEFIIAALLGGIQNTGVNAAWVLCALACSSHWQSKILEEVRAAAAKYTNNPSLPLYRQLCEIPIEAWETEFPMIDLCARDSIRLNVTGSLMRMNISGRDLPIPGDTGEVLPAGAIVLYPTADVLLNPVVYKDPREWDPSRYLPDRDEDKNSIGTGFIGWGSGLHPCPGMRFAKLQMSLITAFFVASFDFHLEDAQGNRLDKPPSVNFDADNSQIPEVHPLLRITPRK